MVDQKSFNKRRIQGKIWNSKKILGLPQGITIEKVTFINLYRDNYKLYNMCAVLEISSKTYYKYRNKEAHYYLIIKEIYDDFKDTYGYRRMCL